MYEQGAAPLRLVAVALLTGCTVTGLAVLLGMDRLLLANGLWAALTMNLAMLIGLTGVAAADIAITRTPQPYPRTGESVAMP